MIFDMEHLDKLRDKSLSSIHFGTFYVVLPWLGSSCNTLYCTVPVRYSCLKNRPNQRRLRRNVPEACPSSCERAGPAKFIAAFFVKKLLLLLDQLLAHHYCLSLT